MDNQGEKKYGLVFPSKRSFQSAFLSSKVKETKRKIFAADSSSDDNLEKEEEESLKKATEKSVQRNQAMQAAFKALAEDPTIFQYDELYDGMQEKKEEKIPVEAERKPKYIDQLLRSAEQRKLETARRTERKIQKERESEGDMFKDKESFITPAYQAKLEERKLQEEEERRKEQMEAVLNVTKQRDLGGFYRHFYKQTFADQSEKEDQVVQVEKKEVSTSFQKKDAAEPDVQSRRRYRQRREDSPQPEASVEESVLTEPVDDAENIEEHPKGSKTEKDSKLTFGRNAQRLRFSFYQSKHWLGGHRNRFAA